MVGITEVIFILSVLKNQFIPAGLNLININFVMKTSVNWESLKSNFLNLGALLIASSGVNFVIVTPSFADTVEQFSDAGIVSKGQSQVNESIQKDWQLLFQDIINKPAPPSGKDHIFNQPITEEIYLVVRLGEKRVYVYQGKNSIKSYPIAVGKPGYETPQGSFNIFSRQIDPTFKNFKTGAIIPPGKNNPLGNRWIGVWSDGKTQIGFHGTNNPESIGRAVSHGCIRMHNKDVMALYEKVKIGTLVRIEP